MSAPSGSYYTASANPHASHPRLGGEQRADVCVIGAGMTGLTAALELAGHGYNVAVVEARHIAWGASGRSGGQIISGFNKNPAELAAMMGAAPLRPGCSDSRAEPLRRRATTVATAASSGWPAMVRSSSWLT